ncbi:DUF4142 domain-containing protein [Terrarubrum flagellatum]|uniref:DUF4142 domain-containing protein n=1 Tax=Terrirubrum flagellatum TaxID=2895980 RepID=UPI0031452FA6
MKTTLAFALGLSVLSFAAVAQAPAPLAPPTPRADSTGSIGSTMTRDFMTKAASANMLEIETSRLALDKSSDADVRQFAEVMIRDHGEAAVKFRTAAQQGRLTPPMAKLDIDQARAFEQLKAASGEEFNRKFIMLQKSAHADAMTLFQAYAQNGDNPAITSFAQTLLPTLQSHQQMVEKLGDTRS